MTKSDVMKEFLKKTVIPVVVALCLFSMFSRIFVENGAPDYFLIWLACGVPFGIGKMFTLIPIGFGISGTVGVVALNLVLGGLIGGVILIWKLAVAIWYLPLTIYRLSLIHIWRMRRNCGCRAGSSCDGSGSVPAHSGRFPCG